MSSVVAEVEVARQRTESAESAVSDWTRARSHSDASHGEGWKGGGGGWHGHEASEGRRGGGRTDRSHGGGTPGGGWMNKCVAMMVALFDNEYDEACNLAIDYCAANETAYSITWRTVLQHTRKQPRL